MRTRLALAAVPIIATLGLAGCGDDPGAAPAATLPVIHVGPGARSRDATGAEVAAADATMVDAKMFADVEYVLAGDLPELDAEGVAWSFPATGARVDDAVIRRLAATFGLDGEIEVIPADQGGGARVGSDDGSAPSLYVGSDATQTWYYSGTWALTVGCSEVGYEPVGVRIEVQPEPDGGAAATGVAGGSDGGATVPGDDGASGSPGSEPCAAPEPPVGVPGADEARATAVDLLTRLGLDPAAYELEVQADAWSANVTAFTMLGGVRSPMTIGFGFGGEGALQYASGFLAEPTPVGTYPLIGVEAGLARLREGDGGWRPYVALGSEAARSSVAPERGSEDVPAPGPDAPLPARCEPVDPATAPPAVTEGPATTAVGAGAGSEVGSDVTSLPVPCGDADVPETITVTIVDVRADLWQIWDAEGTVWLLPAYTFVDDQGGSHIVPAVPDEYRQYDTAYTDVGAPASGADPLACGTPDPAVCDTAEVVDGATTNSATAP